jgi:hypothetical protein
MLFSSRTQTNIFLRNIQQSKYADVVMTLQSHVNAYICEDDDGYLPTNLCINGIATSIHTNAARHVRDIAHSLPQVRRAFGDTSSNFWNPSAFVDDADLSLCAIQGYLPQIYWVDQGWDHNRPPSCSRLYDRANPAGRCGRDNGRPTPHDWNSRPNGRDGGRPSPSPRDCSIRSDWNRWGFLPDVQCEACKQVGHVATDCDMLAMVLYLDKYSRQSLSDNDKSKVESAWLHKHQDCLGLPQRPPSRLMKAFCAGLDISLDILHRAMNWDCWSVDESDTFLTVSLSEGGLSK